MGRKKQKFSDVWVNQTTLGKHFGLSAVAIGKKLKEFGLRSEDGKPTEQALSGEVCKSTPLKDGTLFYMWNKQKVFCLMQDAGLEKLDPKEVKARELADDWIRINKQFQETIYGFEEKVCIEESRLVKKEAKLQGLIDRVNEILRERKFEAEFSCE